MVESVIRRLPNSLCLAWKNAGHGRIWGPRECASPHQVLLKPTVMYGKGGTRWFPAIINEGGEAWWFLSQVRECLTWLHWPFCKGKEGEELGRLPSTHTLIPRCSTHERGRVGAPPFFLIIVITMKLLRWVREGPQSQTFLNSNLPHTDSFLGPKIN
jgi:hypothetical protein